MLKACQSFGLSNQEAVLSFSLFEDTCKSDVLVAILFLTVSSEAAVVDSSDYVAANSVFFKANDRQREFDCVHVAT